MQHFHSKKTRLHYAALMVSGPIALSQSQCSLGGMPHASSCRTGQSRSTCSGSSTLLEDILMVQVEDESDVTIKTTYNRWRLIVVGVLLTVGPWSDLQSGAGGCTDPALKASFCRSLWFPHGTALQPTRHNVDIRTWNVSFHFILLSLRGDGSVHVGY